MTLTKPLIRIALATAFLLLIPLVAMQFTSEVAWTLLDFVTAGGLLFGTGLTYEVVAQRGGSTTYRVAVGVAVAAGLLLVWANLAVGLIGSEHNPANLLYAAVPAVALIGAIAARSRPLGTSRAMLAAAVTYVVITAVALLVWQPSAATAELSVNTWNVVACNAFMASLWVISAWLFRRASRRDAQASRQLA